MMKKFMTIGAFSKGWNLGGDPGWEKCGTHSRQSGGHDNLRPTLPRTRERYVTSQVLSPLLAAVWGPDGGTSDKIEPTLDSNPCHAEGDSDRPGSAEA
jgi:hypothetical protein